jgi:hypothetical protein
MFTSLTETNPASESRNPPSKSFVLNDSSINDQEFQRWYKPPDLSVESIQNRKAKILKPPHLSVGSPLKSKI